MIIKNFYNITKAGVFQFIGITVLISFLIFLLNILFGLSYNISNFSDDVKNKLGVYFYIKENPEKKDQTYSKIISLKSALEGSGLNVEFYSKDDALDLLSKRMPDVIKNFEKYGIENPLPPTLYVIFDNKQEYEHLSTIIKDYKDIILNIEDISRGNSFSDQETRIKNIINLTNFLILFGYFLIFVLLIIIVSFFILVIKIIFYNYYKQIEVEKLLGAPLFLIKVPFLLYIFIMFLIAFGLMLIYFSGFFSHLNDYFIKVFEVDLFSYMRDNSKLITLFVFGEFIVISLISLIMSNFFLNRLIKKV